MQKIKVSSHIQFVWFYSLRNTCTLQYTFKSKFVCSSAASDNAFKNKQRFLQCFSQGEVDSNIHSPQENIPSDDLSPLQKMKTICVPSAIEKASCIKVSIKLVSLKQKLSACTECRNIKIATYYILQEAELGLTLQTG